MRRNWRKRTAPERDYMGGWLRGTSPYALDVHRGQEWFEANTSKEFACGFRDGSKERTRAKLVALSFALAEARNLPSERKEHDLGH